MHRTIFVIIDIVFNMKKYIELTVEENGLAQITLAGIHTYLEIDSNSKQLTRPAAKIICARRESSLPPSLL